MSKNEPRHWKLKRLLGIAVRHEFMREWDERARGGWISLEYGVVPGERVVSPLLSQAALLLDALAAYCVAEGLDREAARFLRLRERYRRGERHLRQSARRYVEEALEVIEALLVELGTVADECRAIGPPSEPMA